MPKGFVTNINDHRMETAVEPVGGESASNGFLLYRYPDWTPQQITPYGNGGGDEDAQAVDINGDGALDIVIGGLAGYTWWIENPLNQGKYPYRSVWNAHTSVLNETSEVSVPWTNKSHICHCRNSA
jgi:hypothetical protein